MTTLPTNRRATAGTAATTTAGAAGTMVKERPNAPELQLFDGFSFPLNPDDWGRGRKVCQYFNSEDETDICTVDPEYFIRAYCWDPGCLEVHEWYYCLRHFGANIGTLAHDLCAIEPGDEIVWYLLEGDVPARYQLIEWGRIGEEGTDALPDPLLPPPAVQPTDHTQCGGDAATRR